MEGATQQSKKPPTREEAANLIIGLNSPVHELSIKEIYQKQGFAPPEDFIVTSFDWLILSSVNQYPSLRKPVSTKELIDIVNSAFAALHYKSLSITRGEIDMYFTVLRGDIPGKPRAIGRGKARSSHFPIIRERYNILYALRYHTATAVATYKEDVQYVVAEAFLREETALSLKEDGLYNPHLIIDMMILDLFEFVPELLKDTVLGAVDECLEDYPESDFIHNYRDEITAGKFLAGTNNPLAQYLNKAVSRLWLETIRRDSSVFHVFNREYTKPVIRAFIQTGPGAANEILQRKYKSLGNVSPLLGSYIVYVCFNLPIQSVYSYADFVDRRYDGLSERFLFTEEALASVGIPSK